MGEILFAKEGPIVAKKWLNFVATWVGFEYEPELQYLSCYWNVDQVPFLEIICFITDHFFLKSELTESSLSWKNFFLASLMRKLYLLRYLWYLNLLSAVGFNWNCLLREFFPLQELKRPCENQGFEEQWGLEHAGWRGNDILYAEVRRLENMS